MTIPESRGVLPADADLDEYFTLASTGAWGGRAQNVVNAPITSVTAASVFEVMIGATLNAVVQRWTSEDEFWWRERISNAAGFSPWRQVPTMDDIPEVDGMSTFGYDEDGTPYIADGAGSNPQPPSRRLITEQRLNDDRSTLVESGEVRRIIVSDSDSVALSDGDFLLVYEDED